MEPIYSMTALQRNTSEVKEAARKGIVRITEQGSAGFIFASEEAFERRIAAEREDAACEARLLDAVGRGAADIGAGRYTQSLDKAFDKAAEMRTKHA
jgi:transcriptional/translational regulatory protein YebC/TACO1